MALQREAAKASASGPAGWSRMLAASGERPVMLCSELRALKAHVCVLKQELMERVGGPCE